MKIGISRPPYSSFPRRREPRRLESRFLLFHRKDGLICPHSLTGYDSGLRQKPDRLRAWSDYAPQERPTLGSRFPPSREGRTFSQANGESAGQSGQGNRPVSKSAHTELVKGCVTKELTDKYSSLRRKRQSSRRLNSFAYGMTAGTPIPAFPLDGGRDFYAPFSLSRGKGLIRKFPKGPDGSTSSPRAGHRLTTSGPQAHHERGTRAGHTTSGPQAHHERATGSPRAGHRLTYHERATGSPRAGHRLTTSGGIALAERALLQLSRPQAQGERGISAKRVITSVDGA